MNAVLCAACGVAGSRGSPTFCVDRPNCSGEFCICETCWLTSEYGENWNEAITQQIIGRLRLTEIPLQHQALSSGALKR